MDAAPSASSHKRPRTGDSEPLPVVRSDIWYPDGSIVIQAGCTQFRVHASLLSGQSTVFKDMFALGTSDGSAMVESCAVVELSDSAADVGNVLRVIYDQSYFDPRSQISLDVLFAVIKLGKKYDMRYIHDRALWCIAEDVPDELYGWDKLSQGYGCLFLGERIKHYNGWLLDLARFARSEGLVRFLPQLLHASYSSYGVGGVMLGVDNDGKHVEGLPYDDVRLCIQASDKMNAASLETFKAWAFDKEKVEDCRYTSCAHEWVEVALDAVTPKYNILDEPEEPHAHWFENICDECKGAFTNYWSDAREKLWRKLPSYFDMPPWHELRAQSRT